MKLAVLLYGQPRFFDKTYPFLKEEFDLDGYETTYFGHLWGEIGYTPNCDRNLEYDLADRPEIERILRKEFNCQPEQYVIDNYENSLDEFTKSWIKITSFMDYELPLPFTKHWEQLSAVRRLNYTFGQYFSLNKSFRLMERYEQKHKIKFDVVIKCRTDVIYFNKKCYKSEELYKQKKNNIYNKLQFKTPEIYCWGLKKLDFIFGEDADSFFNYGKEVQQNLFEKFELNWQTTPIEKYENGLVYYKDNSTEKFEYGVCNRITMNDWMLIANRQAAPSFYKYYFQYFLELFLLDLRTAKNIVNLFVAANENTKRWQCLNSLAQQGYMGVRNNVSMNLLRNKRYIRVINASVFKPNQLKSSATKIKYTPGCDLQEELITHFNQRWPKDGSWVDHGT